LHILSFAGVSIVELVGVCGDDKLFDKYVAISIFFILHALKRYLAEVQSKEAINNHHDMLTMLSIPNNEQECRHVSN
jgi:hypothetical protein